MSVTTKLDAISRINDLSKRLSDEDWERLVRRIDWQGSDLELKLKMTLAVLAEKGERDDQATEG